ncbi:vesicle coat component [Xanthoria parietina]
MTDQILRQSEDNGLGSWHPAHMPESIPKPRLSNDTTPESLSSQNLKTSQIQSAREDSQSPRYIPGIGSEAEFMEDQAFGDHAISPPLEPFMSKNGNGIQLEENLNGQSFGVNLSAGNQPDGRSTQDDPDTALVNGLSFTGQPTQDASIPGSPQRASGYDSHTAEQELDEGIASQRDVQTLPAFGTLDRTNSFPAVLPLDQSPYHAQSQVESIPEEEQHTEQVIPNELSVDESQRGTNVVHPDQEDLFGGASSVEEDDFFNHPFGAEEGGFPITPTDDEARFEEGLPLVSSDSFLAENRSSKPNTSPDLFDSRQDCANEGFFGDDPESHQDATFFKPKILDRKSTGQVLHGMTDDSYDGARHAPTSQKEDTLVKETAADTANLSSNGPINAQLSAEAMDQKEEDLAALWQAALDDDDLLDDAELPVDQPVPSAEVGVTDNEQASPVLTVDGFHRPVQGYGIITNDPRNSSASPQNRYTPAPAQQTAASPLYPNQTSVGHEPSSGSSQYLSHSSSAPAGFGATGLQQLPQSHVTGLSRPGMPAPAQSFADKSKGGYTSPYDLPMDVTRPKRRNHFQQVQTVSSPQPSPRPQAPPRSTSMCVSGRPADALSPPLPPLPGANPALPSARPSSSGVQPKASVGSFFEELLPATKSRPPSSLGRYAPAAPQQQPEPPRQQSLAQRPASSASNAASNYQLVPPERQSPYANLPQPPNATSIPAQANSRYSPAPGSQSNVPPPRNRYAVSPAAGGSRPFAPSQAIPFQPRTSSPLAQNSTVSQQAHRVSPPPAQVPERPRIPQRTVTAQRHDPRYDSSGLSQVEEHFDPSVGVNVPEISNRRSLTESQSVHESLPSHSNLVYAPIRSSPSHSGFPPRAPKPEAASTSRDTHQHLSEIQRPSQISPNDSLVGPPRRPQTQSPGVSRPKPDVLTRTKDVHQRPASAVAGSSYGYAESPVPSQHATTAQTGSRQAQDLHYIRPEDGREHDPLERWKGGPIFKFGFGGTIVTSFPKQIPRYTAGHGFPMIKCSPGEVKLQIGNRNTLGDEIASFPGPLKSKSKKKELLEWLQRKIDILEGSRASVVPSATLPDPIKRHEEKVLLWKIMKIFVEYDGSIAQNNNAEEAVRTILCPALTPREGTEAPLVGSGVLVAGVAKPEGSRPVADPLDPSAMESVRQLLSQGEREKAVWHAVDRRMWAHAMVLASTLDKSVWKQVLHEFTRLEVKPYGENTDSLAALYEVFAGNWEESIDELVPPSARAGLQMVSKAASTGPTRNALDGLDKWRETLTLILSNRTQDDEHALVALGRLLAGYSRIEAAHLCLMFAKPTGLLGGTEDAQASVFLLGADHQQQPFDYGRDLDSILLTEVYEFARSVLASSANLSLSPHLQSYKLYHAILLAENGHRSEAQQYCDAILGTLKSTTKPSPYYHSLLFTALDDLLERLQQAPRDGSSWMSKPMDKMSGSMWKRLNNFIVGDEGDLGSTSSGRADQDTGPFARVAADAPAVSRSASSTELYSAFASPTGPSMPAPTSFGSRYAPSSLYAPSGQYTPRLSLEQHRRPSEDQLSKPAPSSTLRPTQSQAPDPSNPSRYTSSPAPRQDHSSQQYRPTYQPSAYDSPKSEGYLPTPPLQPDQMPVAPPNDPSGSLYPSEPLSLSASPGSRESYNDPANVDDGLGHTYEPFSSEYDPSASTYQPPSSYAPYDPEGPDKQVPTEERSPRKKQSFMDDDVDDDFAAKAAAVLKGDKARKDREANEAFRKAAEADAQKDLKPKKSGWFGGVGGWLGGKKDDDLNSQEPKAIKAKLGEESSFYYDKELKKWVNKKAPAPAALEGPKAPPPRGPPSRAVSGAGGPPMSTSASRTETPPVPPLPSQASAPIQHQSHPPSGSGTPARKVSPTMPPTAAMPSDQAPSSGPPSAPPSRPPTAVGGGGGGGGNIDDLLGEPQVRKGGTMKRGKKGRGYIDVMAK